ncbi:MAG: lipoyl(octanoyl) transferase LipB, partial [Planctomycetota bacterium]
GRLGYRAAYEAPVRVHADVLAGREAAGAPAGRLLVVEHDPVITVTRRPGVDRHVLATEEALARAGVGLEPTDRGGDVTYHGPGQLVVYPIVDLKRLGLRVHEYMRTLEAAVIETLGAFGLEGRRDADATGVWLRMRSGELAKVCAMGVRLRRWVTMHGLALNVRPELSHFGLIVPCGLVGRPVTSMHAELGDRCPSMAEVGRALTAALSDRLLHAPSA